LYTTNVFPIKPRILESTIIGLKFEIFTENGRREMDSFGTGTSGELF
jgi:hypothetical protein